MGDKDLEKRKRVMQRSMRLGHCVCDPKMACPCETFRTKNVCLCAGERLETATDGKVRLTQLVEKAGCASKIDQAALKGVLAGLPFGEDSRVLVGACAGDDAGVYLIGEGQALVQTVDVFSPSVDDPYTFGQIAAANSVSDIYAMGGRPVTALSIVGFPISEVADSVLREILRGGMDKMAEAGVAVIGGHSIQDKEIKAGFAVTGMIDPAGIVTNAGVRPGDVLVLTKPIGTGVLSFAGQIGRASEESLAAAARSMAALNKAASEVMVACGAHACTDVTGFGLLGHLGEMARSSGVDVEVVFEEIPLFDGVMELAVAGVVPGATERNRESSLGGVDLGEGVTAEMVDVCCDPQTSGGLLIAVEEGMSETLVRQLHEAGVETAARIGRAVGEGTGRVRIATREVTGDRLQGAADDGMDEGRGARTAGDRLQVTGDSQLQRQGQQGSGRKAMAGTGANETGVGDMGQQEEACCATGHGAAAGGAGVSTGSAVREKFQEFLRAANAPGALDAPTKQAIAIALSVVTRCEPCTKAHIAKARKMGFTQAEIDEAVWMAIAFGGSPTMMFVNGVSGQQPAANS